MLWPAPEALKRHVPYYLSHIMLILELSVACAAPEAISITESWSLEQC